MSALEMHAAEPALEKVPDKHGTQSDTASLPSEVR